MTRIAHRPARLFAALAGLIAVVAALAAAKPASAAVVQLDGVRTSLTTDPATTAVLVQQGILPLPVQPSPVLPVMTQNGFALRYQFPITGGSVDAETLAGRINHSGGLRFVNLTNGKWITLSNFRIVIDDMPRVTAEVNNRGLRVPILKLDLGGARIDMSKAPYVAVSNVVATLTQPAAEALNASLGVDVFAKGIKLGRANVLARVAS